MRERQRDNRKREEEEEKGKKKAAEGKKDEKCMYRLYAVVVHIGNMVSSRLLFHVLGFHIY